MIASDTGRFYMYVLLIHRIPDCIEVLKELNIAALDSCDSHGRALYICCCFDLILEAGRYIEDMNFMFEWQKRYLTSERSERVRCRFCHENIKFRSLSQRVMFLLSYGYQMKLILPIFISSFSKNRASFTNHRSSS